MGLTAESGADIPMANRHPIPMTAISQQTFLLAAEKLTFFSFLYPIPELELFLSLILNYVGKL
jgi:hypothetical protein